MIFVEVICADCGCRMGIYPADKYDGPVSTEEMENPDNTFDHYQYKDIVALLEEQGYTFDDVTGVIHAESMCEKCGRAMFRNDPDDDEDDNLDSIGID